MMRFIFLALCLALGFIPARMVYAETLVEVVCDGTNSASLRFAEKDSYADCLSNVNENGELVLDGTTREKCDKLIAYPLYCAQEGSAARGEIGVGLADRGTLRFSVEFEFPRPSKKVTLLLSDGTPRTSLSSEIQVMSLPCSNNEGGSTCQANLPVNKLCRLSKRIDLDAAVQNVHIRKGSKEVCLGKFSNDESLLTKAQRTERQYCSFTPSTGYESVSGWGFFDPAGYGTQGESQFYLAMEGLPTGREIVGCTPLGSKYKEVLSFESYGPESTDAVIYRNASEIEKAKISAEPLEYSYDLYRSLQAQSESIMTLSRSLAQINRQVSPQAAISESRESDSRYKDLRRANKKKKRKQKKNADRKTRNLFAQEELPTPQSAITWLAFDPLAGGDVILANNCKRKNVESRSYGTISCTGSSANNSRICGKLSNPLQASYSAQVCYEQRRGYNLLITRIEGAPVGEYYVCNGSQPLVTFPITVAEDELGTYGELFITDNSSPAEAVENLYFGTVSNELSDLKITGTPDCAGTPLVIGSL
jgi:hypothetical protein